MTTFANPILNNISPSTTLWDLLEATAVKYPHNTAIQMWEEERISVGYTYREFLNYSKEWGLKLQKIGVKPGDRIAILSENSLEFVLAIFAITYCQATVVLLEPRLELKDHLFLIEKSDPQIIITTSTLYQLLTECEISHLTFLNIFDNLRSFSGIIPSNLKPNIDGNKDIALMVFTSGTTGLFRGALLEHTAILYATKSGLSIEGKPNEKDQILNILPLTHIFGIIVSLCCPLAVGATITFIDKIQSDSILTALKETKTTVFPVVPRFVELFSNKIHQKINESPLMIKFILNQLIKLNYRFRTATGWNLGKIMFSFILKKFSSHLKYIVVAGAPLSPSTFCKIEGLGFTLLEGYGLSESGNAVFCNLFTDKQRRTGSVGKKFPWVEVKILSSHNIEPGEILVRGPTIMQGYFRDPEATAEVLKDGWLHTGDLGYLDADGYLFITGRIKELILMSSGEKAMPQDIEERYSNIPHIKEIAAFGVPNAISSNTEEIHAAIVVHESLQNSHLTLGELQHLLNESVLKRSSTVPHHLRIQEIHIVSALPKTVTLKVKRRVLRDLVLHKKQQKTIPVYENNIDLFIQSDSYDELTSQIIKIIKEVATNANKTITIPLSLQTSFQLDLEFDSLMSLELIFTVEKTFQKRLPRTTIQQSHTIGDIVDAVRQTSNATGSTGLNDMKAAK